MWGPFDVLVRVLSQFSFKIYSEAACHQIVIIYNYALHSPLNFMHNVQICPCDQSLLEIKCTMARKSDYGKTHIRRPKRAEQIRLGSIE